jgi:hypothetical protein
MAPIIVPCAPTSRTRTLVAVIGSHSKQMKRWVRQWSGQVTSRHHVVIIRADDGGTYSKGIGKHTQSGAIEDWQRECV